MKFFTLDDTSIDIIYSDTAWIPIFVHYDWLLPLDEFIGERANRFAGDAIQNARYNGKMYALPYNLKGNLLYYRKDILERNNLEVAKSINEMKSQVRFLRNRENIDHALVYHSRYFYNDILPVMWANGGAVVSPESGLLINSPENREVLETFREMIAADEGYTVNTEEFLHSQKLGYDWPLDEFVEGKALYMINWSNRWNKIHSLGEMEGKVGVAPIMSLNGAPGRSNYGGWYLAVNKNSKHPAESVDFLLYLLGEKQQRIRFAELSELPSLSSLYNDEANLDNPDNVPLKQMYDILNQSRARIPVPSGMEIGKICDKYFTDAVTGNLDVAKALELAENDISEVFKRFQERSSYELEKDPISLESLHDYSLLPILIMSVVWLAAGIILLLYRFGIFSFYSLKYKIAILGIATTILSIITGSCLLISMTMSMQHDELRNTVAFHNKQITENSSTISKKIALAISSLLENENRDLTSFTNITIPRSLADLMAVAYFDRDVRSIQVIDTNGTVIVSDRTYLFDTTFQMQESTPLEEIIARVKHIRIIAGRLLPDNGGYEVLAPIYIQGTYFGAVRHVFTLDNYLDRIELIKEKYQTVIRRSVITTLLLTLLLASAALWMYLSFSSTITQPITELTRKAESINHFNFRQAVTEKTSTKRSLADILKDLSVNLSASDLKTQNESSTLAAAFTKLASNLSSAFSLIETQNKDLHNYRDHLEQMVEEKSAEIMDSIRYASVIQSTILPEHSKMPPTVREGFFALWKPRDIVGGDFYWYTQSQNHHIFALGDCTGHGVPGALMTMTAASSLHSIAEEEIRKPSEILEKLDETVRDILNRHRKDTLVHAGLDIGILMIDSDSGEIHFSGAGLGLYTADENGIHYIPGVRRSIGYKSYKPEIEFVNHSPLTSSHTLVMATDGYIHQIGSIKNISFGRSRFIDFLEGSIDKSPQDLVSGLETRFEEYRGSNPQLDDVTVIGLKMPKNYQVRKRSK